MADPREGLATWPPMVLPENYDEAARNTLRRIGAAWDLRLSRCDKLD